MADKDDTGSTPTDRVNEAPGPIEHAVADVTVIPGPNGSKEHAKKVERQLQNDVEQAIEEARDGGADEQVEAATDAVDKAMQQTDPSHVAGVEVDIYGEVDGKEFYENISGTEITEEPDDSVNADKD